MNIYLRFESSMLDMGVKNKKVDINFNKSENFQIVKGKGINLKGISIDF